MNYKVRCYKLEIPHIRSEWPAHDSTLIKNAHCPAERKLPSKAYL